MFEQILKHRPKGATHWDVGTYYKKDGDKWFYWDRLWFRVADLSTLNMWMTTLSEEKEPAMSEFKVGDKVVLKSSIQNKVMTIQECYKEFIRAYWDDEHYSFGHESNFRFADTDEIAAGHRIDMPTLPEPVGSLQELHPEFAKVLHENFLELLGDESNTVQVVKDAIERGHGFAMVSIEGVEHVSRAQVIRLFPFEELGDDSHIENHISPLCKSIGD
ncbi:hypothetical protein V8P49_01800 [Acinetobacter baumannii]